VVSFTPPPLYPWGKNPWYLLNRRLVGLQSQSGCCGEEKILALLGIEPKPFYRYDQNELIRIDIQEPPFKVSLGCGRCEH
jgi:hypothetical protein